MKSVNQAKSLFSLRRISSRDKRKVSFIYRFNLLSDITRFIYQTDGGREEKKVLQWIRSLLWCKFTRNQKNSRPSPHHDNFFVCWVIIQRSGGNLLIWKSGVSLIASRFHLKSELHFLSGKAKQIQQRLLLSLLALPSSMKFYYFVLH